MCDPLGGANEERDLFSHPKAGSSWEGYALEEVIHRTKPESAYFWATHTGAELDLLLFKGGRRYRVEEKLQDAPRVTPSMRIAMQDLGLERLAVVYPGEARYALDERIEVMPLSDVNRLVNRPDTHRRRM